MADHVERAKFPPLGSRSPSPIAAGSTGLLVVDMQYSDACPGRGLSLALERIEPGCMRYFDRQLVTRVIPALRNAIGLARSWGMPIYYLSYGSQRQDLTDMPPFLRRRIDGIQRASGMTDIFWVGNPDYQIIAELLPRAGDQVIAKSSFGGFSSGDLSARLTHDNISAVIIGGVSTSCCVESTARGAVDRGLDVYVIAACCGDYTAEAHETSLRSFQLNFGQVVQRPQDMGALIRADPDKGDKA